MQTMTHLIDKDALVSEIERLQGVLQDPAMNRESMQDYVHGGNKIIKEILSFINTLEVKEVHLDEHQIADIIQNLFPTDQFIESETLLLSRDEAILFAKHFLELGLKARQG